jgi:hypothetical protein
MMMRKMIQDIYKVLVQDETLLRLLHYKPKDALDDPLDPSKPNILDMEEKSKWKIINDCVATTPQVSDLDTSEKCRILFYFGRRERTDNYLFANQEIIFDVITHVDFDGVDQRLSWICDRVNELIFNKRLTGIGKIYFSGGGIMNNVPNNYTGYKLLYTVGSENS